MPEMVEGRRCGLCRFG